MNAVITNYPKSEYVDDARTKLRYARDQLAGKEMQIGRYYERSGRWLAASYRFRNVVETYQTTSHAPEALFRLGSSPDKQVTCDVRGDNAGTGGYVTTTADIVRTIKITIKFKPDKDRASAAISASSGPRARSARSSRSLSPGSIFPAGNSMKTRFSG